jgi:hypothetical protein
MLPSPEVFELCFFSSAVSTFASLLPFFFSIISVINSGLIIVSVSECVLDPFAGCISVPLAVVLPVIAKGENPGVCAMKRDVFHLPLRDWLVIDPILYYCTCLEL